MKVLSLLSTIFLTYACAQDPNLDRFNYRGTTPNDYGPADWQNVRCSNTETCLGWPEGWEYGRGWDLNGRSECWWCPREGSVGSSQCGNHHQSPIYLDRRRGDPSSGEFTQCEDEHWMEYYDSSCTFDRLVETDSFTIERHALRVGQPIRRNVEGRYILDCPGGRWGILDYAKGFPQWWLLSHMDIKLPSEHIQNGKRYSGEIQLHQFYEIAPIIGSGSRDVTNEMGTVSFFIEAEDDFPDNVNLNRLICQFRRKEEEIREQCGLESVPMGYPGCWTYTRFNQTATESNRKLHLRRAQAQARAEEVDPQSYDPRTVFDLFAHNFQHRDNASYVPKEVDTENFSKEHAVDFDWEAFIEDELEKDKHRHLLEYDELDWFNYWPLLDVRTEYYFRYQGTQTVPPCYGDFLADGTRRNTNHWRVLKDPIRISVQQLNEFHRLIRERIAPPNARLNACQPDTAAAVDANTGRVDVARPLQSTGRPHFDVYCECVRWPSKWPEDREYCRRSLEDRLYRQPYNYLKETEYEF